MTSIILWLLCCFWQPTETITLPTLPDVHLSSQEAQQHAVAARVAAYVWDQDPDVLLALAWHESRFTSNQHTPEAGGRESCGVATPEPLTACSDESLIEQYLDTAQHLAAWQAATGKRALIGYAGGYILLHACADGRPYGGCTYPAQISALAAHIGGH